MAITAILLTIIGIPLVQSLNITRATQAFAEAQDVAREINTRISRELSTAVSVLDNSHPAASVEIRLPLINQNGAATGTFGWIRLHNAKIDFIPPAKGDPSNFQYNPGRNKIDPTLRSSIGQIIVPIAPGQTLVRYWIGLRYPLPANGPSGARYVNSYTPVMAGAVNGDNNLFVLYRAEVEPYVFNNSLNRWVPNTALFPVDPNTGEIVINDPGFYEWDPSTPYDNINAHRQRLQNWAAVSRIMVQDSRTDLIIPVVDEATGNIAYEAYAANTRIPRVRSLVTFQPVRVSDEPATANEINRGGEEVIDAQQRVAAEFFQTKQAGWTSDALVRLFRVDPRTNPRPPYYIGRWSPTAPGSPNLFNEIVYFNPAIHQDEYNDGDSIFNITQYMQTVASGNPRIGPSIFNAANPVPLMLFTVEQKRGRIQARFPAVAAFENLPTAPTSAANAKLTGWLASPTRGTYNQGGDLGRRFLDLRDTLQFAPAVTGFNPLQPMVKGYDNTAAKIMPGSEVVVGPDQRPGPNFGRAIRYTRVAQGEPVGLNQYKINYTDIKEPTNYLQFLGVPDPAGNADVRNYIQPRFKKGYIEFHSDPTLPLPEPGNIQITFDFQVNEPADAVVVDYDTNQQIRVEVTIRRFSGGTNPAPQTVTVTDVVAVRNFAR